MKIWQSYGSEHSANLVMVGHFKDAASAAEVKNILDQLTKQVQEEVDNSRIVIGDRSDRYSEPMLALVRKLNVWSLGAAELEQFAYDVSLSLQGTDLELRTDENDVSAFFKIMFDKEARIEIYSASHREADTDAK